MNLLVVRHFCASRLAGWLGGRVAGWQGGRWQVARWKASGLNSFMERIAVSLLFDQLHSFGEGTNFHL